MRDRDLGWNALGREIIQSSRKNVTVGVHSSSNGRAKGSIGNVALATIHEFGSPQAGIPERSFIRLTTETEQRKWMGILNVLGGKIYRRQMTVAIALRIMGLQMETDTKRTIDRQPGNWPRLRAGTVAAKSSAKMLIDTRELLRSISHKVTG